MSLKRTAISGIIWSFTQQFSSQIISFIVSIILARIILPEEFGLIGLIAVFVAIGNTLVNAGLSTSLIRTIDPTQKDYSTVFFINIIGSVLVYVVVFFCAPLIANFFKQEVLTDIIRLYTVTFIINAFSGIQTTKLTKEMNFKTQMFVQIPSLIVSAIVGIYLAYSGFGVWSLVWMSIAQALVATVQLWVYSGWKPDFIFDRQCFNKHFGFGYKLMLSGLIDTIYNNIYNIVIGKYFSLAQVGFYTRALSVRQLPVSNLSNALNKVTYPLFSKIQDDDIKLKETYKKLMEQVVFWIAGILIYLCVVAEPFFRLLFTEIWLPAVPYFQLLCVGGILYPIHAYNLNILNVKGRSDLFFKLEVIKKIIITIGIIIAIPFGIYGLLYFQIIASVLAFFINTRYSGKLINYSIKEQLSDIVPIIIVGALVGVVTWLFNKYLMIYISQNDLFILVITFFVYYLFYFGISLLIKMRPLLEIKLLIFKR